MLLLILTLSSKCQRIQKPQRKRAKLLKPQKQRHQNLQRTHKMMIKKKRKSKCGIWRRLRDRRCHLTKSKLLKMNAFSTTWVSASKRTQWTRIITSSHMKMLRTSNHSHFKVLPWRIELRWINWSHQASQILMSTKFSISRKMLNFSSLSSPKELMCAKSLLSKFKTRKDSL